MNVPAGKAHESKPFDGFQFAAHWNLPVGRDPQTPVDVIGSKRLRRYGGRDPTTTKGERFKNAFKESQLQREPALNRADRVLAIVTRELDRVPWGDVRDIQNMTWHLYLLHWDQSRKLLFINSSNNDSLHEELAKEVCGDDVSILRGEDVFRCLHGMRRSRAGHSRREDQWATGA